MKGHINAYIPMAKINLTNRTQTEPLRFVKGGLQ
jgi:hypothetical protein